ncbi:hypothetical protein ABZ840_08245 [Streptomyces sp. NPDC047117]
MCHQITVAGTGTGVAHTDLFGGLSDVRQAAAVRPAMVVVRHTAVSG